MISGNARSVVKVFITHQLNVTHGDLQECLKEALCALWTLGSLQHQLLQSAHPKEGSLLERTTVFVTHVFVCTNKVHIHVNLHSSWFNTRSRRDSCKSWLKAYVHVYVYYPWIWKFSYLKLPYDKFSVKKYL